jgi:hypothetical protein
MTPSRKRTLTCLGTALGLWACLAPRAKAGLPICFEAESADRITPPMELIREAGPGNPDRQAALKTASGKAFLEIPQGKGNPPEVKAGDAVYTLDIPAAGRYILWCRVWWSDVCSNSFTMQINDNPPFSFGQDAIYGRWHWVKAPPRLKQLTLDAGSHVLTVMNREDGVRIDQILLTADSRFVPIDIEDVTVSPRPDTP